MSRQTEHPERLYGGGTTGDARVYGELVKMNKNLRVIRGWVTVVGVFFALLLIGVLVSVFGAV